MLWLIFLGGMLGTTDLTVPNGAGTSPVGKCGIMSLLKNSIVVLVSQLLKSNFLFWLFWRSGFGKTKVVIFLIAL